MCDSLSGDDIHSKCETDKQCPGKFKDVGSLGFENQSTLMQKGIPVIAVCDLHEYIEQIQLCTTHKNTRENWMREPIRLLNKDVGKPAQVTLTQESREHQKQRENDQIRKPYIIKKSIKRILFSNHVGILTSIVNLYPALNMYSLIALTW